MIETTNRTARYLYRAVRRFGWRRALALWWSLHLAIVGSTGARAVPVPTPGTGRLLVRPGTADASVYDRILLRRAMALDFCPQGQALLRASERSEQPQLIVDAGAYTGFSSIALAQMFPKARILAVEPDPANFAMLQENVASFANIEPINAALWHRTGSVGFVDDGASSWAIRVADAQEGNVPAISMEDLLARHPGAELLAVKLVIEGAERQLFSADAKWLGRAKLIVWMPPDWRLPGAGAGRATIRALAPHAFDYVIRDECLFCFRDLENK